MVGMDGYNRRRKRDEIGHFTRKQMKKKIKEMSELNISFHGLDA